MKSAVSRTLLPLAGALTLVVIWQIIAVTIGQQSRLVPTPGSACVRWFRMVLSGDLNADVLATLWRWVAGFTLATLAGAPIGLLLGSSNLLYRGSSLVIDFLRSLPVTALFPVFLIFFGVGTIAMIAMTFSATVFIIIVSAIYGVQSSTLTRRNMALSFGASPSRIFWGISLMEALHHILVGMRTALSLSLVVAIVSEMFIGAEHGLGQRLYLSYQTQHVADLYALILTVGTIGYAANWLFIKAERRIVFWMYP